MKSSRRRTTTLPVQTAPEPARPPSPAEALQARLDAGDAASAAREAEFNRVQQDTVTQRAAWKMERAQIVSELMAMKENG